MLVTLWLFAFVAACEAEQKLYMNGEYQSYFSRCQLKITRLVFRRDVCVISGLQYLIGITSTFDIGCFDFLCIL